MTYGLLPGAEQKQVAVEGVRLAVHVAGPANPPPDATPVLLLHGVPQTSAAFRFLLPELAKDRVVVAPDLKGLGESEVRGPYDLDTVSRELAALVLHEVDAPVDVVGHDWGGTIALALAKARPDLVRRVVVVNGPYRYVNLKRAAYIPFFLLPVLPEVVWRVGGRRLVRRVLSALWKADEPLDPVIRTHYERLYTDPERITAMLGYYRDNLRPGIPRAATGAATALARLVTGRSAPRRSGTAAGSSVRADAHLVLWGAADPVLGMDVAEATVRDLGADTTMVGLPGVGHFPLEEAPADTVPIVAEFLRGSAEPLPLTPTDPPSATGDVADLEMPVVPRNKASGRDPDAQRAVAARRVAELKAETARKAAVRRAERESAAPADAGADDTADRGDGAD
jgi:pimeloyl-ACP methyl ester carboxylesterase